MNGEGLARPQIKPTIKKDQIWQRPNILRELGAIEWRMRACVARDGAAGWWRQARPAIGLLRSDPSLGNQLRALLSILVALRLDHESRVLGADESRCLLRTAQLILDNQGIRPVTSRLSWLHGMVHASRARLFQREAKYWLAEWERELARVLGADSQSLDVPQACFNDHALDSFVVETAFVDESAGSCGCAARARSLRLAGELGPAQALLALALERESSPSRQLALRWELACLCVRQQGELSPLLRLVRREPSYLRSARAIDLSFWTKIVRNKQWLRWRPPTRLPGLSPSAQRFLQCERSLERCYDPRIPLYRRLRDLSKHLEHLYADDSAERKLLFLAASARWLHRIKQRDLCRLALLPYQAISRAASGGRSEDSLGVLGDFCGTGAVRKGKKPEEAGASSGLAD